MNSRATLKLKIERLEKKKLRLSAQITALNEERTKVIKRTFELRKRLAAPLAEDKSRRLLIDTVIDTVRPYRGFILVGPFPHPSHGRLDRWWIQVGVRKVKGYAVGEAVTVELRFEAREGSRKRTWVAHLVDKTVQHHELHGEHPGYDS